jgi:hypothetical protein
VLELSDLVEEYVGASTKEKTAVAHLTLLALQAVADLEAKVREAQGAAEHARRHQTCPGCGRSKAS